jgi:hypothetical protein
MGYAVLKIDGKQFVLVPKAEFTRLTSEDRRDGRKAKHALTQPRAGKLKTVSHASLKRELGL